MTLVELKKVVLQKSVEAFSKGDMVSLDITVGYVFQMYYLREQILTEDHSSRYCIHPRATKMYCELREVYWWNEMKKDIVEFMDKCPHYQKVKVEHKKP